MSQILYERSVFFLACFGYLQMFFLPGALLLKAMGDTSRALKFLLRCTGLSLVLNYLLTYGLVAMGRLHQPTVLSLLVVEIIAWAYLYRHTLRQPVASITFKPLLQSLTIGAMHPPAPAQYHRGLRCLLVCFFVWVLFVWVMHAGEVFHLDDELYSWNRWALAWSAGHVPDAGLYPQLIPTNFALFYQIIGRLPEQPYLVGLARLSMPFYTVMVGLMMLDLAHETHHSRYRLSVILWAVLVLGLLGKYVTRGLVDIPLAYFTFLCVYTAFHSCALNQKATWQDVLVIMIFSAGCAVTKQGGLYMALFFPAFFYVQCHRKQCLTMASQPFWIIYLLVMALTVLPWYVHAHHYFLHGNIENLSSRMWTVHGHHGNVALNKLIKLFEKSWLIVLCFGVCCWQLKQAGYWRSIFWFFMPYAVGWAVVIPDVRNASLFLPVLACVSSGPLETWFLSSPHFKRWCFLRLPRLPVGVLLLLMVAGLALLSTSRHLSHGFLLRKQGDQLQQYVGERAPRAGRFNFYPHA